MNGPGDPFHKQIASDFDRWAEPTQHDMAPLIYIALFLLGVVVATQLNRGIYRLAWDARAIGPWSTAHPNAPGRSWTDRIPVIGWFSLRREASIHGRGFWVRPMLLELATGACFAALYWHEVGQVIAAGPIPAPLTSAVLHAQFFKHIVLFSLMLVATFIDFDEQTIPDAITVPGVLIGLIFAVALPISGEVVRAGRPGTLDFMNVVSGSMRNDQWREFLQTNQSLVIGLACFVGWWLAVIPWLWTTRCGLRKAFAFFAASFRRRLSWGMIIVAVLAVVTICLTWKFGNPPAVLQLARQADRWNSLFTALVGVAAGGGIVWAVRIIGSHAMGQEAMGFGDVTLMAMIGAFLGWQATLIIFFLAPFAALFISVTQWLLTRRRDIAFGPYLCLGACYLVVDWAGMWGRSKQIFELGMFVPGMLAVGLALMGIMLIGMRWLRETFLGEYDDDEIDEPASADDESDTEPEASDDASASPDPEGSPKSQDDN